MATNHKFEVVGKEVVFSAEAPTLPLKLFTVTGDVLAKIIPVITSDFTTENAIISIGTQAEAGRLLVMDTLYEETLTPLYSVSSDLYLTVGWGDEEEVDFIGTVTFYCVYAKLSQDGEVEEVA